MLIIFCLLLFCYGPQDPTNKPSLEIVDPVRFDEWHDVVFSDEKARLDNVSVALRSHPGGIIYLIVYAGERACVNEAKARGIRAKNYLMRERNVPASNIVWLDGGFKSEVTTQVWILPRVSKTSILLERSLSSQEVKLERGCKIKYRGGGSVKRS